ncbi:MAG: DUF308 domain-containing protein [Thermoleophilaceae bacterium]|nr:DUF308 domain-containing protein [Thermoleophilaceae bacterium]
MSESLSAAEYEKSLASASKWSLIGGVLAIIVGLVAIFVPAFTAFTSVSITLFLGWILLFGGAVMLVDAFGAEGASQKILHGLLAIVTGAVGLYLLVAPLDGTYKLTVILVIWFVAVGFIRLVSGIAHLGQQGAGFLMFNGFVSLLLGLLIANNLPSSATWAIGLLVGIELLFAGMTSVALHFAIKNSQ